jgi:hypothetical protein
LGINLFPSFGLKLNMTQLKDFVLKGKVLKPDLKRERKVDYIVLLGMFLLLFWMLYLLPKVFVEIQLILFLFLVPGLLLTPLFYKKIFSISGYKFPVQGKWKYNSTMIFLAYCLGTIPVGSALVTTLLLSNSIFADHETKTIILQPFNIAKSSSGRSSDYSHIDVEYDGIIKQFNYGKIPVDNLSDKSLRITLSKGFFGYYIIRKRTLISKQ